MFDAGEFVFVVLCVGFFAMIMLVCYVINKNKKIEKERERAIDEGQFLIDALTPTARSYATIISSAEGCGDQTRYLKIRVGDFKITFRALLVDEQYTFRIPTQLVGYSYEITSEQ